MLVWNRRDFYRFPKKTEGIFVMFLKKFWEPLLCIAVLCLFGFLFFRSNSDMFQEPKDVHKATEPDVPLGGTPIPEQSGTLKVDGVADKRLPDTDPEDAGMDNGSGSETSLPKESATVEKALTPIEKLLLERGIDITQLPRGPNGELLRGPTGGIALVPNPVAPTPEEIERFEREKRLRERLAEIEAELLKFADKGAIDMERYPVLLDLEEEKFQIQKTLGMQFHGPDPLIAIKITRYAMEVMTDAGIPVSSAPRFIELFEEIGAPDTADMFRTVAENAERNGDAFFNFFPPLTLQPQGAPDER